MEEEIKVEDYILIKGNLSGNSHIVGKIGVVRKLKAYKANWFAVKFEENIHGLHNCDGLFNSNCGYFVNPKDIEKLYPVR